MYIIGEDEFRVSFPLSPRVCYSKFKGYKRAKKIEDYEQVHSVDCGDFTLYRGDVNHTFRGMGGSHLDDDGWSAVPHNSNSHRIPLGRLLNSDHFYTRISHYPSISCVGYSGINIISSRFSYAQLFSGFRGALCCGRIN